MTSIILNEPIKTEDKHIHNFLIQKIHDPDTNHTVGLVLARKNRKGEILFGWSLVNTDAGDRYDRDRGVITALKRSKSFCKIWEGIPYDFDIVEKIAVLRDELTKMRLRAIAFYKDGSL